MCVCVYIWMYNKYLQLAWKSTKNCLWCHCNILWGNFASLLPPTPLWAEMPSPGTGFQSFIQYIIALCIHPPAYTPTPFDGANTLRKGWRHFRNDIWMRNGVVYGGGWGERFSFRPAFSSLLSLRLKFYNKFVTKIDLCAINDKNEKKTSS